VFKPTPPEEGSWQAAVWLALEILSAEAQGNANSSLHLLVYQTAEGIAKNIVVNERVTERQEIALRNIRAAQLKEPMDWGLDFEEQW
jgi:hypothetical protein